VSCAFDLAHYGELLEAAKAGGYRFGFFEGAPQKGEVLLRHDVDLSLDAALRMAELEADAGAVATYFLMTGSVFYNLSSHEGEQALARLRELGHRVDVADPLANPGEVEREYGLATVDPDGSRYDLVVGAVAHAEYRGLSSEDLENMVDPGGTLADLKGMWRDRQLGPAINRWSL